jgi:peroxiredoxin
MRSVVWAAAVIGVAAGGFWLGQRLGHRGEGAANVIINGPWKPGDPFPTVTLRTEAGDSTSTATLLRDGGVVLFLDLECPPCLDMARKWNRAVADGLIPVEQVVAIADHPDAAIGRFRADNHLDIAVYRDPASDFMSRYGVSSYPLEVMVDAAGAVVHSSGNPADPIDEQMLAALLNNP